MVNMGRAYYCQLFFVFVFSGTVDRRLDVFGVLLYSGMTFNPQISNRNKSRLLFSSAEMF